MTIFGVPPQLLFGQLLLGLINGSFYAVLSLGLAVIFGMLNIIKFAHGAQYMVGAFVAWIGLAAFGVNYWESLLLAPLLVGAFSVLIERLMLRRLYQLDHLYGLLLTFGLALIAEGVFRNYYGISGESYEVPEQLQGGMHLGFMFLPLYRAWVVVAALGGATQRPDLVQALGINVPLLMTLTYAAGAGLAAFAGVLAAPVMQVNPLMGSNLIIVVFAVVVIGGMGSILGSIVTGVGLGLVEALTKVYYPQASAVVIFLIMVIVLMVRPAGLFGRQA